MQQGFVIDHSRCIGCHACTVACKSENDVPLGSFRTWVKYTERGQFPETRRSFAVLRCNQCSDAPCVTICPVGALHKRDDGIVDIDSERCIGCKSCLQACPYDALYIHDATGTAEKCHFCAHRFERGLAPACAVVCPTEAIIPGDFDDPESRVSQMKREGGLAARKQEAGTSPNVWYRDVDDAGIAPLTTNAGSGFIWAQQQAGLQLDTQMFERLEDRAAPRTVYDVTHPPAWGTRVSAYLGTKSLAAGAFVAGLPLFTTGDGSPKSLALASLTALLMLALTSVLLVADLKRPERFWYILRYPNWSSWLTRGTLILMGYGALLTGCLALALLELRPAAATRIALVYGTAALGVLTAAYTAWLFAQSRGRVLWMGRGMAPLLVIHAILAGASFWLLAASLSDLGGSPDVFRSMAASMLLASLALGRVAGRLAPRGREREYARSMRVLTHGPLAGRHRTTLLVGTLLPLVLFLVPFPAVWILAAVLALVGLVLEQDDLVRAGQATAIS
ncbi:MAG: polysulfide reductase NrfD [bacterium]|nr:polysulfide reductase NrfD [bacterium]